MYFFQLHQEAQSLNHRSKRLLENAKKASANGDSKEMESLKHEQKMIGSEMESVLINTFINAAYFPLTIHWSIEGSKFPDIGVGICGTAAAIAQIYATWKST